MAFRAYPGIHTAGDLIGQALVQNVRQPVVLEAATHVLKAASPSAAVQGLAERILSGDGAPKREMGSFTFDQKHARQRVALLRAVVRREPLNAIRWADLALAHLNLGAIDAARREVVVAASLAPTNRYVLRAGARLYLLLGDPERAHDILTRHPDALDDPWIHAAELAVTQVSGRSTKGVRRARDIVDGGRFAPWHVSELAGELATAELRAGQIRQANKHMRQALIDPTENALAQAEWAANHGVRATGHGSYESPFAFEARALVYASEQRYQEATVEGARWQADQPFAPEPAIFTSYVAAVGAEDYDASIIAARRGLVANPEDGLLRNNLVFALASSGRTKEAREELLRISRQAEDQEAPTLLATRGLVAFREGNAEGGRQQYRLAVEALRRRRDPERAALAAVFWAREELFAKSDDAVAALVAAQTAAKGVTAPEVRLWVERLKRFSHPSGM